MSMDRIQITRRHFNTGAAAALCQAAFGPSLSAHAAPTKSDGYALVARVDHDRILKAAKQYLSNKPITVTASTSPRTPGGPHDFFSEADYFWPNPANPDGPYINRDGQSNPNNFSGHRKAMIALSIQMPVLTSAWLLTRDRRYAQHAADHLRAWFINPETRMNPNLEFSQGVHGVSTGRNYGIIDTLHLVEVARAASHISPAVLSTADRAALNDWFTQYLHWMKTSEKGIAEKNTLNNHAVCWALQAAEFARLIGDTSTRIEVLTQYETIFLPNQLGQDGSFPKELVRTKPYSYSIFNFDVMAALCQSLLDAGADPFAFTLPDGRGICKATEFLYPYLKDKGAWPYKKDVEHFEALPVRSPGLLFAGLKCKRDDYLQLWQRLDPDPTDPEIIRNYPVRQPLLWFKSA
ncbi:alginate lyase family protein [Granulicella sp. dw_53]|uniref:alginate lyase family protein n=1 Tax=Granulicella sp. dw_53 TaxID=2719792 RepID=UPI00210317A5|nr:alginate lyase family protein [Granulicella sp. dw_53]